MVRIDEGGNIGACAALSVFRRGPTGSHEVASRCVALHSYTSYIFPVNDPRFFILGEEGTRLDDTLIFHVFAVKYRFQALRRRVEEALRAGREFLRRLGIVEF